MGRNYLIGSLLIFIVVAPIVVEKVHEYKELEMRKASFSPTGNTFRDCPLCPEMVVVPGGSFTMGSNDKEANRNEDEGPVRKVNIRRFALSKYLVTQREFQAFANQTKIHPGYTNTGISQDNLPAIMISFNDANRYGRWLRRQTGGRWYRVPTEAELEYATRAGTATSFYWGNEPDKNNANCNGCSAGGGKEIASVGSYPPNAFGLYDMVGNVWQWAQDCYHDNYNEAPTDGSAWDADNCTVRVMRGGSWNLSPQYARSANRDKGFWAQRRELVGLRIARDLPN